MSETSKPETNKPETNRAYKEIKARLRQASARAAVKDNVIRFRPDLSPCPGDTFSLRELSGVPAELLIVERDPADARRLRGFVLDDYPQIGSTDVELDLGPGRVANIRCDLDAWLDVSRLNVASRTGMLPPESLAEVHRKHEAIDAGDVYASLHEEEVDGDPEYRRWKDETLRGVLSLFDASRVSPARSWTWTLRAVAASAVLVVGASWAFLRMDELREQVAAQGEEMARLEASRHELSRQLKATERGLSETSEALSERDREVAILERQVETLAPTAFEPNMPFVFMNYGYGSKRHAEHTITVPEGSARVGMVVEVVDAEPYSHYGVRITEQQSGDEVWTHNALQREGAFVRIGLPASRLPSGDYMVVLSGYEKGAATPLDEWYLLHVRRPGER